MKNTRIYKKDAYIREYLTSINKISNTEITLDETIFFPNSGGQPGDRGLIIPLAKVYKEECKSIDGIKEKIGLFDKTCIAKLKKIFKEKEINFLEVINTTEGFDEKAKYRKYAEKEVIHHIAVDADKSIIGEGDKVLLILDWEYRHENMQRHTGEHIVSGLFFSRFEAVNKGFHMGEKYMTIDLKSDKYEEITLDMALDIEREANEAIWSNLPTREKTYATREEASREKVRKEINIDEEIRIVKVGEGQEVDCVACCGTHVKKTGEIGLIKIYKVEKNKDMWRVYLDAGRKAYEDTQKRYNTTRKIYSKFSADADTIEEKLDIEESKQKKRDDRFHSILNRQTQMLAENILKDVVKNGEKENKEEYIYILGDVDKEELSLVAKKAEYILSNQLKEYERKVIIFSKKEMFGSIVANVKNTDVGKAIKKLMKEKLLKGGGSKNIATFMTENTDNLKEIYGRI